CLLHSYAAPPDLHSFPTRRSSDLAAQHFLGLVDVVAVTDTKAHVDATGRLQRDVDHAAVRQCTVGNDDGAVVGRFQDGVEDLDLDRKSTRLNSSHVKISYAVFCLK